MSSSPETSTRTTGAHRAHREARDRAAAHALARRSPAPYEPYLDGLFTYCLSVLCDHDEAVAALADALVLAERRGQRLAPSPADRRAWLYALARWACLRKLADAKRRRQATHAAGRPGGDRQDRSADATPASLPEDVQQERQRELARLAWPEAAGTSPEQREALELAVRHQLAAHEVAAVLGTHLAATRELLAAAACEVERTRAALAVAETGGCPGVAALTGDSRLVLSPALRRELVRHVDDCPRCRRSAERAVPGRWPGASVTPAELPVIQAPRAALRAALAQHPRARAAAPRFDRRGFPMDPKDRAARRDRLRARAVTTTVVATVVAAPVLALWAAYRGTPTGEGQGGPSAAARESPGSGALSGDEAGGYQNTGNDTVSGAAPDAGRSGTGAVHDVSVQVTGVADAGHGAGRLTVTATGTGDTTFVTLTASGSAPVHWSATTGAAWLYPSRSSGTLQPGTSTTIRVHVDPLREPSGPWRASVAISPAGAVVTISGYGTAPSASRPAHRVTPPQGRGPHPTPPPTPSQEPSDPPPSDPPPSSTTPSPTPDTPSPDPGTSTPPADGSGAPTPTAG